MAVVRNKAEPTPPPYNLMGAALAPFWSCPLLVLTQLPLEQVPLFGAAAPFGADLLPLERRLFLEPTRLSSMELFRLPLERRLLLEQELLLEPIRLPFWSRSDSFWSSYSFLGPILWLLLGADPAPFGADPAPFLERRLLLGADPAPTMELFWLPSEQRLLLELIRLP